MPAQGTSNARRGVLQIVSRLVVPGQLPNVRPATQLAQKCKVKRHLGGRLSPQPRHGRFDGVLDELLSAVDTYSESEAR